MASHGMHASCMRGGCEPDAQHRVASMWTSPAPVPPASRDPPPASAHCPARQRCAAAGWKWPARNAAGHAQPGGRLGRAHDGPGDVGLLRRLLPGHVHGAASDPPRRPRPCIRVPRRARGGGSAGVSAVEGACRVDAAARGHRRVAGRTVHGDRKLVERAGRARASQPRVRRVHGGLAARPGGRPAAARPAASAQPGAVQRRGDPVRAGHPAGQRDTAFATGDDRRSEGAPAGDLPGSAECGRRRGARRPGAGRVLGHGRRVCGLARAGSRRRRYPIRFAPPYPGWCVA